MAKAKPTTTPKSDQQLGTLIAAVLAHPDTPSDVYNGIVDGLSDLGNSGQVLNEAPAIQAILDHAKERATEPKASEQDDEESKTVTMTRFQYDKLQKYGWMVLELARLMEPKTGEEMPTETLQMIGDGIADIFEDLEAGRLDYGKLVRPVVQEKGGAV